MTSTPRSSRRGARTRRQTRGIPSLRVERGLHRSGYAVVAGMDEVGRGALAGPVSVGVVIVDANARTVPQGVRDSKLLSAPARVSLVPRIQKWALGYAVGHASPAEIDAIGIMAALRLAGVRALEALPVRPDIIVLDGNHDWLTAADEVGLFAFADEIELRVSDSDGLDGAGAGVGRKSTPPVHTVIKADVGCSSVAAASVLAKVERDDLMVALAGEYPAYRWELNKGYAAPEHLAALAAHGTSEIHRRSWRLGGAAQEMVERDNPETAVSPTEADSCLVIESL